MAGPHSPTILLELFILFTRIPIMRPQAQQRCFFAYAFSAQGCNSVHPTLLFANQKCTNLQLKLIVDCPMGADRTHYLI